MWPRVSGFYFVGCGVLSLHRDDENLMLDRAVAYCLNRAQRHLLVIELPAFFIGSLGGPILRQAASCAASARPGLSQHPDQDYSVMLLALWLFLRQAPPQM